MRTKTAAILGLVGAALVILASSGCGSMARYRAAENAPPAQLLNRSFSPAPVSASLASVIVYHGPGSWKRDALWDEYVVVAKNPGDVPVTLTAVELEDAAQPARVAGDDPWKLEMESAALARGASPSETEFAKEALPMGFAAGFGIEYSAFAHWAVSVFRRPSQQDLPFWIRERLFAPYTGAGHDWIAFSRSVGYAYAPLLIAEHVIANREDSSDIEADFRMRRFALPFTLAPRQARAGAFFFPMSQNPRALKLRWQRDGESGETQVTLEFLRDVHGPGGRALAAGRENFRRENALTGVP
jgi:hypothetical protein